MTGVQKHIEDDTRAPKIMTVRDDNFGDGHACTSIMLNESIEVRKA